MTMEYIYENPTLPPQESPHWKALTHEQGDKCIQNLEQLAAELQQHHDGRLALWSALLGYCESLCTSTKQRFYPFPIPIDAIQRLVDNEFTPPTCTYCTESNHREAARQISNYVWSRVVSKSNIKDETHANSLYTVLRGHIETKSVDCFGAAVVTVIALRQQGHDSILTLSEDHAYLTHDSTETCEVAIPGNTKAQQLKRGQEISKTFQNKQHLTVEDSWLYMAGNAVQCNTNSTIIAAILANINCVIETKFNYEKYSEPLLLIKRDLLWKLYDSNHLAEFPFALCELAWSEEHVTSKRGEAFVPIQWQGHAVQVTTMEKLYHDAIEVNVTKYMDKQVYPYTYLGYFHKNAEEEYRQVLALQFFSQAARVASSYKYDSSDTLQLTKVFTKIFEYVIKEIVGNDGKARTWQHSTNAVACAKWLILFYDHLFLWEERSGHDSVLPICDTSSISKAFALLSPEVRQEALQQTTVQSQRLKGSLRQALEANKVNVSDMHLTIVADTKRRRKRKVMT